MVGDGAGLFHVEDAIDVFAIIGHGHRWFVGNQAKKRRAGSCVAGVNEEASLLCKCHSLSWSTPQCVWKQFERRLWKRAPRFHPNEVDGAPLPRLVWRKTDAILSNEVARFPPFSSLVEVKFHARLAHTVTD